MPKMNVITEEVDYTKIKEKNRDEAVLWRKLWKNRICSLTPHWHISDVTYYGECSRKKNTISRCLCQSGDIESDRNPSSNA